MRLVATYRSKQQRTRRGNTRQKGFEMTGRELLAAQINHNLDRIKKSVPEFAKQIDMPKQTIYRLIRCECAASNDIIDRLAAGFDIPASVLSTPVVE